MVHWIPSCNVLPLFHDDGPRSHFTLVLEVQLVDPDTGRAHSATVDVGDTMGACLQCLPDAEPLSVEEDGRIEVRVLHPDGRAEVLTVDVVAETIVGRRAAEESEICVLDPWDSLHERCSAAASPTGPPEVPEDVTTTLLNAATQEAIRSGDSAILPIHLLMAVFALPDSWTKSLLRRHGLRADTVVDKLRRARAGDGQGHGEVTVSRRVREIISRARSRAERRRESITRRQLVLSFRDKEPGFVNAALKRVGVRIDLEKSWATLEPQSREAPVETPWQPALPAIGRTISAVERLEETSVGKALDLLRAARESRPLEPAFVAKWREMAQRLRKSRPRYVSAVGALVNDPMFSRPAREIVRFPSGQLALRLQYCEGSLTPCMQIWCAEFNGCLDGHRGHPRCLTARLEHGIAVSGGGTSSGSWTIQDNLEFHEYRDGTLVVWDLDVGKTRLTIEAHESDVLAVGLSGDAGTAASCASDGAVRVWDLIDGACLWDLSVGEVPATDLHLWTDASRLAARTPSSVFLWDFRRQGKLRRLPVLGDASTAMVVGEMTDRLFVAFESGKVRSWDCETGDILTEWQLHDARVRSMALVEDRWLLSTDDTHLQVWDCDKAACALSVPTYVPMWIRHVTTDGFLVSLVHEGGSDSLMLVDWDLVLAG